MSAVSLPMPPRLQLAIQTPPQASPVTSVHRARRVLRGLSVAAEPAVRGPD